MPLANNLISLRRGQILETAVLARLDLTSYISGMGIQQTLSAEILAAKMGNRERFRNNNI
jgi:hypothetical protein